MCRFTFWIISIPYYKCTVNGSFDVFQHFSIWSVSFQMSNLFFTSFTSVQQTTVLYMCRTEFALCLSLLPNLFFFFLTFSPLPVCVRIYACTCLMLCVCVNLYVCVFDTTGTLWWELTQGWTKPSSVTIPWPLSKVCVRETLKGKCVYQHHWQTECNVEEKAEVEVFFIISFLEKS